MEKSVGQKLAEKANGDFNVPHTVHRVILGDSRAMPQVADDSVHLVVTSPPYWTLKKYEDNDAQLGAVSDYEQFLGAAASARTRSTLRSVILVPTAALSFRSTRPCSRSAANGGQAETRSSTTNDDSASELC